MNSNDRRAYMSEIVLATATLMSGYEFTDDFNTTLRPGIKTAMDLAEQIVEEMLRRCARSEEG